MPDCQLCWNEWPELQPTPLPQLEETVQVCRNCGRDIRRIVAFVRFHGFDITEASPGGSAKSPPTPQPAGKKSGDS